MTYDINRRSVLKGIGAGAFTLTFAGTVSAGTDARYLINVDNPGVEKRVEKAGFSVPRALADGMVLLATGPRDNRKQLENTNGVLEVARDYRFELELPVSREPFEAEDDNGNGNGKGNGKGESTSFAGADDSTDDELFPLQWDKQDITTDAAIAHERATGAGTTIAVIDTGVDVDGHPDLPNVDVQTGRLFRDGDVLSGTGDVEFPADVFNLCAGTTTISDHVADDVYFHGTHVAGIAGASRAGTTGVIGTAPDTEIVPLRVFWWDEFETDDCDSGVTAGLTTTTADILSAIDHASATGVDAMNMSLGTPPLPPQINATGIRMAYERVIQRATQRGSLVVVSAGNSSANLQQGGYFTVPNSVAGAMSISATGPNDKLTYYSNFGTNEIDVGAPGGGYETVEKTLDPDADVDWPFPTNFVLNASDPDSYVGQLFGGAEYLYVIGTSMAAPQVAGAAALVREVAPGSTARQVENAIKQGAEDVPGQSDSELGAGRLNCDRALDADAIN